MPKRARLLKAVILTWNRQKYKVAAHFRETQRTHKTVVTLMPKELIQNPEEKMCLNFTEQQCLLLDTTLTARSTGVNQHPAEFSSCLLQHTCLEVSSTLKHLDPLVNVCRS